MDLDSLSQRSRLAIADAVIARIGHTPFGSVPKRELDTALFAGLVDAGVIDPNGSHFEIARTLGITPGRVRGLVYAYRLANADGGGDVAAILDHVRVASVDLAGDAVLVVADDYARDALVTRLKDFDVFHDGSFNRERVKVPAKAFLDALDGAFGRDGELIREALERLIDERGKDGRLRFAGDLGKKLVADAAGVTLKALLGLAT
jgi:hypothetical protein